MFGEEMNSSAEFFFWLFIGALGMFIGGLVGIYLDNGSISPDCWIGLAVVWGMPIFIVSGGDICD